jgi:hypothetical protein
MYFFFSVLIIIGAVVGALSFMIVTAGILVLCICCRTQHTDKEKHHYGIENPAMTSVRTGTLVYSSIIQCMDDKLL